MNDFHTDLSRSKVESGKEYWNVIYQTLFPTMISQSIHDNDMEYQKRGIDRLLFLEGGKIITIDEKVRYKDYGDILLEESSSVENHIPGWIEKPLWTDYITYVIPNSKQCYLLPFLSTQLAWWNNKDKWKLQYKRIEANNGTYTTLSWGIPIIELYVSIARSQMINYA